MNIFETDEHLRAAAASVTPVAHLQDMWTAFVPWSERIR
jgi:hypothetical protein